MHPVVPVAAIGPPVIRVRALGDQDGLRVAQRRPCLFGVAKPGLCHGQDKEAGGFEVAATGIGRESPHPLDSARIAAGAVFGQPLGQRDLESWEMRKLERCRDEDAA
jgi:hypothetical protein